MAQMDHDNLIKSYGFSEVEKVHWVMEKCDGSLKSVMEARKGRNFLITEIRAILMQILTGLSFLHGQKMMHRLMDYIFFGKTF